MTSPGEPRPTQPSIHAILLGASLLTSAGVRRWRFHVLHLYTKFSTSTSHQVVDARGLSGRSANGATSTYATNHSGGLRRHPEVFRQTS